MLTTVAVIVLLTLGYLFIYLPNNEKNIQAQRFRALQNVDRNLHDKIENSVALLNNLLSEFEKSKPEKTTDLENYIQQYSTKNFTLLQPESIHKENWEFGKRVVDSGFTLSVNYNTKNIVLTLKKKQGLLNDSSVIQIGMKFSFEQFIKNILPENIFDEFIVFSENKPVYETFPSGISYAKNDSLLNIKNGIGSAGIINQRISGVDYKFFLQPVVLAYNSEWVIGGLLSGKRYQNEKSQLPTTFVLTLITLLLGIIITFPWIKLFQMGGKDRLTITDGILTLFISMLLISLLFFTFFKYNLPFRNGTSTDSKNKLSTDITNAFKSELASAYQKINAIDSLALLDSNLLKNDIVNFTNKNKIAFADNNLQLDSVKKEQIVAITNGINIVRTFWLDESGFEITSWNKEKNTAPHGRYDNREYFKKINSNNPRYLNNDINKKYYLEQVTSWNSGMFTSVISIPSHINYNGNKLVAALSLNIKSLDSVLLPTGYQFAIIENKGKVLYHSDKSKNLNENLLDEFSEKETLLSHLISKTNGIFLTEYAGKKYNVLIKPITGMPYYTVIFGDTIFKETRDMEIYSFSVSMMLIFFGVLVIQLLTIFLVSSRRSFLKKQLFDTSWIGPKISCNKEYLLSTLFNMLLTVMLFICFKSCSFLLYFFMLVYTITAIPLFLNKLFAIRYTLEKKSVLIYKKTTIKYLLTIIILINIVAVKMLLLPNYFFFLTFQLSTLLLAYLICHFNASIFKGLFFLKTKIHFFKYWNHTNSFTAMGFTRLIITSGIPIVFFYYSAYNYEQQLGIRYKQQEFSEKLNKKIPIQLQQKIISSNRYPRGIYMDGAWINKISMVDSDSITSAHINNEEFISLALLKLFRINFSETAIKEDKFYLNLAEDSSLIFNKSMDGNIAKTASGISFRQSQLPNKYIKIESNDLNYKFPDIFKLDINIFIKGLIFWGMLIAALIVYYFILLAIVKKLFALSLPDLSIWKVLDNKIMLNDKLNRLVFVIGLPGSGKRQFITNLIKQKKIKWGATGILNYHENDDANSNVFMADMINIPDSSDTNSNTYWENYLLKIFDKKNKLIIVNHFEYNIQDATTNRIKLNLLERLMLDNQCKIVILSSIHPVAFLDSIYYQTLNPSDKIVPGQDLERWHVLLGHYRIVLLALESGNSTIKAKSYWQQRVIAETNYTHFLNKMQAAAIEITNELPEEGRISRSDELAYKLQITAHYFYMYIWQSLTKEEKFLLYDLAEDDLVNSYDTYNLSMLIGKGVIVKKDGSLKLFNKGFRNFILTAIGNSEALKLKNQITDNGNWSKLKNPLLLVTLTILAFLLTSQEESYSKIITYIAALAAGIPTILKIFSIFEKPGEKN